VSSGLEYVQLDRCRMRIFYAAGVNYLGRDELSTRSMAVDGYSRLIRSQRDFHTKRHAVASWNCWYTEQWSTRGHVYHTAYQKWHRFNFWNNSVKNSPIFNVFFVHKILRKLFLHQQLIDLLTSPVRYSNYLGKSKSHFHQYYSYVLSLCTSSQNKTKGNRDCKLAHRTWKMCTTFWNTVPITQFFRWKVSYIVSHWWLWREPVVLGGKLATCMSGKQRHSKWSKWPLSAYTTLPVFYATD